MSYMNNTSMMTPQNSAKKRSISTMYGYTPPSQCSTGVNISDYTDSSVLTSAGSKFDMIRYRRLELVLILFAHLRLTTQHVLEYREKTKENARHVREKKKDKLSVLEQNIQYLKSLNKSLVNQVNHFRSCDPTIINNNQHFNNTTSSYHQHLDISRNITVSYSNGFTDLINQTLSQLKLSHTHCAYYVINATSYFFPIIYASPSLAAMTGYAMHEVIGQNCGFLCGPQTSRVEVINFRPRVPSSSSFVIFTIIAITLITIHYYYYRITSAS